MLPRLDWGRRTCFQAHSYGHKHGQEASVPCYVASPLAAHNRTPTKARGLTEGEGVWGAPKMGAKVFHNPASEVTSHPFCHMLLDARTHSGTMKEGSTWGAHVGDCWGPSWWLWGDKRELENVGGEGAVMTWGNKLGEVTGNMLDLPSRVILAWSWVYLHPGGSHRFK